MTPGELVAAENEIDQMIAARVSGYDKALFGLQSRVIRAKLRALVDRTGGRGALASAVENRDPALIGEVVGIIERAIFGPHYDEGGEGGTS